MSDRDRILDRVRGAVGQRAPTTHPGTFGGWRPSELQQTPIEGFEAMFVAAGGEVARVHGIGGASDWIESFAQAYASVTTGATLHGDLKPPLPEAGADTAALGLSMGLGAVAETGSLLLDARDGRRTQLLAPTHVVFVHAGDIHATLLDALADIQTDLPSAIGLHSGPSKSADIGQVVVQGVHGPGRIIAVVVQLDGGTAQREDESEP